ncbi:MAG: prolyl oligopeptidase family serine peptidase [Candidatus Dormibacteraeota bacterium]|nr:prolyl oligopeptidase family serine peptidase [Candidatus Dormibacteraeota bacterium]
MGRREVAIAALLLFLGGCSPSAPAQATPSPAPSIKIANFEHYAGAYRSSASVTYIVNGHGHLLNLRDSSFRQLYSTSLPNRFTVGRAFEIPSPKEADVTFRMAGARADRLTIKPVTGSAVVAARLVFKETDVSVPVAGAILAATITEPPTPGPHPGIVIIHGSEPGTRIDYGVWVGFYASLGLTVVAYDKRGIGASTGTYPGEFASDSNLATYAADASAAVRMLASWPGVDPKRVGFYGGSQGGWTVPLAIARNQAPAAFAVLASGPAVSVDQQQTWSAFSASSQIQPGASPEAMDAAVRETTSSGYVPATVLATIRQPLLWVNGAVDRQVPTTVNTEILRSLHHSNWDIEVLPGVDHGLFENASGLEPDQKRATKLATGLWDLIAGWLARTVGVAP